MANYEGFEERRKFAAALFAPKWEPVNARVSVGRQFTREELFDLFEFADTAGVDIDSLRADPTEDGFEVINSSDQDPKMMDQVLMQALQEKFGIDPQKVRLSFGKRKEGENASPSKNVS